MERIEQAMFAIIEDPSNPTVSAALAKAILTTIPVPR